jgi:4'-phosphopantetheinyl transferase
MGIYRTYQIKDEQCFAAVWKITEDEEELLNLAMLSETEMSTCNSIKAKERRKEWLAARALVNSYFENKVSIEYKNSGKPYFRSLSHCLSISHTSGFVAISINKHETGIDIQNFKPNLNNIKSRFLSTHESQEINSDDLQSLTLYWCAKEALFKTTELSELIFKENIQIKPFQFSDKGKIYGTVTKGGITENYLLNFYIDKEFALVFTAKQL